MSELDRETAKEVLIANLSELNEIERRDLALWMRWYWEGCKNLPNQLKQTFADWLWTYEDWQEIMKRSSTKRRRELRRTHSRRIKDKAQTRRKRKAAYMREYMRERRRKDKHVRKSVDEQRGD
jgi:hypothetical protein